jgi:hypothetical protein
MTEPFCLACRGIGCSACQRTYILGRINFQTDSEWKASEPSLSAAIGAVIDRTKAEPDRRSREIQ